MSRSPSRIKRNPRKISLEAAEALEDHRPYKKDNTEVRQLGRDKSRLYLHGSAIAEMRGDEIYVTDAGCPTSTTKERLNALPDVRVHTQRGQLYLNGEKWSGNWARVDPVGTWYELKSNPRKRAKSNWWPEKIGEMKKVSGSSSTITYEFPVHWTIRESCDYLPQVVAVPMRGGSWFVYAESGGVTNAKEKVSTEREASEWVQKLIMRHY